MRAKKTDIRDEYTLLYIVRNITIYRIYTACQIAFNKSKTAFQILFRQQNISIVPISITRGR